MLNMIDLFKKSAYILFSLGILTLGMSKCSEAEGVETTNEQEKEMVNTENLDTATFGGGCFWCTEAIFEMVEGVTDVKSGYSGGPSNNPTYKEVCSGMSGHAEVIQVVFDSSKVSYTELLEIFWKTHDPTTLNQQGADKGTQYRSVIFYHSQQQKKIAEELKQKLELAKVWDNPIVTEISESSSFYDAEKYHQNYYNDNKSQGYCQFVITPKVDKFKKVFADKLKK